MSLQHSSSTPWGVAKCGDGAQLGPLASTDQRDFPYHMLSAQMKKLSKEWCKWEAFIIFNVCLLEQLLHMWKCSFPGSGQTLLFDGKVENNIFFPPFFVHTTFHFGLVNCLIMTYALFSALFPSRLSSWEGQWWSGLWGSWCPAKVNPAQWAIGLLKQNHILLACLGDATNTNTVCSPVLT